jgi:hypothetical protein
MPRKVRSPATLGYGLYWGSELRRTLLLHRASYKYSAVICCQKLEPPLYTTGFGLHNWGLIECQLTKRLFFAAPLKLVYHALLLY